MWNNAECFSWLQKLERWYVEEAGKLGAWHVGWVPPQEQSSLKEQNDLRLKMNDELEDDNETLTPEQCLTNGFGNIFWVPWVP